MQTIDICGKRGLGDLVGGASHILKKIDQDTHLKYWLPAGHDYPTTIDTIIYQYKHSLPHKISCEVIEGESFVSYHLAIEKFGMDSLNKTWYYNIPDAQQYLPFKTKWLGNTAGPVALCLNNENHNSDYPYPGKFFEDNINDFLTKIVDNKRYITLGRPKTIEECINIMAECRFVLGVEGGWTHIANAMRVPAVVVRNDYPVDYIKHLHTGHRSLTIVESNEVFNYLDCF